MQIKWENDVTVVIRYVGESSLATLKNQVCKEISINNVFVIEEKPFSKAVDTTFRIGIEQNKKWTLALDADLILIPGALKQIIRSASKYTSDLYVYQGCVLDKFKCSVRQGGPHLYRTKNLLKARDLLRQSPENLRPESQLYNKMQNLNYQVIIERKIFALHDFFQTPEDMYRKGYFHGIKHKGWRSYLPLWLEKAKYEKDYELGVLGFIHGYMSGEITYPDLEKLLAEGRIVSDRIGVQGVYLKEEIEDTYILDVLNTYGVLYNDNLEILKKKQSLIKRVLRGFISVTKFKLKYFNKLEENTS